jgi:hypothetical protein
VRIVPKNHKTTAAELNIRLEGPVSIKTVRRELHKPTSMVGLQMINLITESNAQMRKRWCHDHKTWTSDNWKCTRDMVR